MSIDLVITNAGRAALVNAANTGTLPLTITQIGLSSVHTPPSAALLALPSELKRISTIAGEVVADDTLHVSLRDESADEYALRSVALYLSDGTLFACAGQSAPILNKAASAVAIAAFDVVFADIAAASLAFGDTDFMLPSATTERQGVAELATVAEAQAGIDALRALTPASAKAAVLGWLLSLDGAGSGLDADLLDGQQGSWYANIPARLGYTPVNREGDVMSGSLTVNASNASGQGLILSDDGDIVDMNDGFCAMRFSNGVRIYSAKSGGTPVLSLLSSGQILSGSNYFWHLGNDGAGSGLDADLLDGQDGSWYANIPARLGYVPLNSATYSAADVLGKVLSLDGTGSGLDADLLDGQQGSWYADIPSRLGYTPVAVSAFTGANQSLAATGQQKLPGGLILKWGDGIAPNNGTATITFPEEFPNACVFGTVAAGKADAGAQDNYPAVMGWARTGLTVTNAVESLPMRWFAIGF